MLLRNSVATFGAQLCLPLISFLLTPFFIAHLGLEGYGLMGFFAIIVTLLGVLATGVCAAVQRDIAVHAGQPGELAALHPLVRRAERYLAATGLAAGAGIALLAPYLATHWLRLEHVPPREVRLRLWCIAITVASAQPAYLYHSIFSGLQLFPRLARISVLLSVTGSACGVAAILAGASVSGFYAATAVVSVAGTLWLRRSALRLLPPPRTSAEPSGLRRNDLLALSAGLSWNHAAATFMTSCDRLVGSRVLPASSLALMNSGTTCGRILSLVAGPVVTAAAPRFWQAARQPDSGETERLLRTVSSAVLLVALTAGLPVAAFSHDVLAVWTRNATLAHAGAHLMTCYMLGAILLTTAAPLYQVQVAHALTGAAGRFHAAAAAAYPLLLWWLMRDQGANGAGLAWMLYALLYLTAMIGITFGRILRWRSFPAYALSHAGALIAAAAICGASWFTAEHLGISNGWPRVVQLGITAAVVGPVAYLCLFGRRMPAGWRSVFSA